MAAKKLRDHGAGKVERRSSDVGVNVDSAREHHHPLGVDRATALALRNDFAVTDANVFDDAVDAVGRVEDLAVGDAKHGSILISRDGQTPLVQSDGPMSG